MNRTWVKRGGNGCGSGTVIPKTYSNFAKQLDSNTLLRGKTDWKIICMT